MITIKKPTVTEVNGWARLSSEIIVDGLQTSLWFEVEKSFEKYLCSERGDAFVLGLWLWAVRHGHDITSEAPMTEGLFVRFAEQFLPAFYQANEFPHDASSWRRHKGFATRILSPTAEEIQPSEVKAIGTGVSMGVDSLYAFATHPEITHSCLWIGGGEKVSSARIAAWNRFADQARRFSARIGKQLIVGRTNFFDGMCLPGLQWSNFHTIGNLFCIFALQKLWSRYYIASGYDAANFKLIVKNAEVDPADYELFLLANLSLGHMLVLVSGGDCPRLEKVHKLIDYMPAQEFLNTCYGWDKQDKHGNCSYRCSKCMRTMLELYALNGLDKFTQVFDVDYFTQHMDQYIAEFYRGIIQNNVFMKEIRPLLVRKRVPAQIKFQAVSIVVRKALRKVMRCWATNDVFSPV